MQIIHLTIKIVDVKHFICSTNTVESVHIFALVCAFRSVIQVTGKVMKGSL